MLPDAILGGTGFLASCVADWLDITLRACGVVPLRSQASQGKSRFSAVPSELSSETRDHARLALYFLTLTNCALTGWHLDPTEACNVAYALCVEVLPHTY